MALRKILSTSGPVTALYPPHPNDHRFFGNREFAIESNSHWVRIWVSWYDLQERYPPASLSDSWYQLNREPLNNQGVPVIREIDFQIKRANDDGRKVILAVYHAYPTWASGAKSADPVSGTSRQAFQKVPLDCSSSSPFGWFIQFLCARYIRPIVNSVGPGSTGTFGNPVGAKIDVLEVVNEPNLLLWPQSKLEYRVAEMMRTADYLSWWAADGQASLPIAGPATSDHPDPGSSLTFDQARDWREFTGAVLNALANWRPYVYVVWSHHNYRDIRYGPNWWDSYNARYMYRAEKVIHYLYDRNWRGGGNRHLWITEGGYDLGTGDGTASDSCGSYPTYSASKQNTQAQKISDCFTGYQSIGDIVSFAQHTFSDYHPPGAGTTTQNFGMRDAFAACRSEPRASRALWWRWRDLGPWVP